MSEFKVITPGFGALPEVAYVDNPIETAGQRRYDTDAPVIALKRGEYGYYPIHTKASAEALNEGAGVTQAHVEAMLLGSAMGWAAPGANPDYWEEQLANSAGARP